MPTNAKFEVLENRTLLSTALPTSPVGNSGSAAIVDGTLVIQGSDDSDTIYVSAYFDTATIHFRNADVDETATFNKSDFNGLQIMAGGGDDIVDVGASLPSGVTVHGGAGNDKLTGGNGIVVNLSAPANTNWNVFYPYSAFGDEGNDTLSGGKGDHYGGEGYDTIDLTGQKTYNLVYDTYERRWFYDENSPIYPSPGRTADDVELVLGYKGNVIESYVLPSNGVGGPTGLAYIIDGTLVLHGTDEDDTFLVTSQDGSTTVKLTNAIVDESATFDNADFTQIQVTGGKGNDRITLDTSVAVNATLDGGDGNDTLTGGGGNDLLTGSDGNDTADYSSETNALTMTNDVLVSSDRGSDVISLENLLCGSGNDTISVYSTSKTGLASIDGGAGDDSLGLSRPNDAGNVYVYGGTGNDTIGGVDAGDDNDFGSANLDGGDGDDVIHVEPRGYTSYSVNGGAGYDIVELGLLYPDDSVNNYLNKYPAVEGIRQFNGPVTPTSPPASPPPPVSPPPASPPPTSPPPPVSPPPASLPPPPAIVYASLNNHILSVNGTTGNDSILIRQKSGDPSVLRVIVNGKITNFTLSDVKKIKVTASNGNDLIDLRGNDFIDVRNVSVSATLLGGNGNDSIYGSDAADSIDGGRGDDLLCGMGSSDSITGGIGHDIIRGGEGIDRLFANKTSDDLNKNKGDTLVNDVLG